MQRCACACAARAAAGRSPLRRAAAPRSSCDRAGGCGDWGCSSCSDATDEDLRAQAGALRDARAANAALAAELKRLHGACSEVRVASTHKLLFDCTGACTKSCVMHPARRCKQAHA